MLYFSASLFLITFFTIRKLTKDYYNQKIEDLFNKCLENVSAQNIKGRAFDLLFGDARGARFVEELVRLSLKDASNMEPSLNQPAPADVVGAGQPQRLEVRTTVH